MAFSIWEALVLAAVAASPDGVVIFKEVDWDSTHTAKDVLENHLHEAAMGLCQQGVLRTDADKCIFERVK